MADETTKPANIKPATEVEASGAPDQVVPDVDMSHPAVDDNPRANTSLAQNRIDFNDPTLSGAEQTAANLRKQGVPVAEPSKAGKAKA
ncbi:hypothetical protein [Methylobacterium sp. E-045]|uniref:hypothetical protein n=1 Tax=Methylobacterium sp. E-045 TaxID=2836575 RepID=UPI001FBB6E0E|nr:hypothetical protein [Methylobacterium sp. E-045]MCJ2132457.1 hypothetical protein [Methylobacterium sp. E-045]